MCSSDLFWAPVQKGRVNFCKYRKDGGQFYLNWKSHTLCSTIGVPVYLGVWNRSDGNFSNEIVSLRLPTDINASLCTSWHRELSRELWFSKEISSFEHSFEKALEMYQNEHELESVEI